MERPQRYQENDPSLNLTSARLSIEKVWTSFPEKEEEHLILPDGRSDFILRVSLNKNSKPVSIIPVIAGPSTKWWISCSKANQGFVGVRFKPGHGGAFFGIPLESISGRALVGNEALEISPKFKTLCKPACDINELSKRLESFFDHDVPKELDSSIGGVIDDIHQSGGTGTIKKMAQRNGISSRSLARNFLKQVGISPKVYAAIIRFHHTLKLLKSGKTISEAAFAAGYSDQAHMTRDFRRFGGFTPADIPESLTLIGIPLP